MLQSLNRHAFSEEVLSCARQKAISLEGGVPRFVTVQFKRNKVGEPIEVVDLWESDDALPYCPPGFAVRRPRRSSGFGRCCPACTTPEGSGPDTRGWPQGVALQ